MIAATKNGDSGSSSWQAQDDEVLLRRISQGDRTAFDQLFARYQGRASAVATEWCRDRASAPDVVVDAFLKVYRAAGSFRGQCSFTTWLHRIVVNCAHDANAKHAALGREIPMDDHIIFELDQRAAAGLTDEDDKLLRETTFVNKAIRIRRALEYMPSDKQDLIRQCYYEKGSYSGLAEQLGVAVGTVKSRLNRARKELRNRVLSV